MRRYCSSCDQKFEINDGSNEEISKTCADCGYGDCTENMWVNSSSASATPKDEKKDEKKEK